MSREIGRSHCSISLDHIHECSAPLQFGRQQIAGDGRAGDQYASVCKIISRKAIKETFGYVLFGYYVDFEMKFLEGIACCRADRADATMDSAKVGVAVVESFQEITDAIRAGEDQPVVIADVDDGVVERRVVRGGLYFYGRQFDYFGAKFVQHAGEHAGLFARTCNDDSPAEKR